VTYDSTRFCLRAHGFELEHAPDLSQGAVVYILPHVAQQVLCAAVANAARVLVPRAIAQHAPSR
jgi:hypothetical protein